MLISTHQLNSMGFVCAFLCSTPRALWQSMRCYSHKTILYKYDDVVCILKLYLLQAGSFDLWRDINEGSNVNSIKHFMITAHLKTSSVDITSQLPPQNAEQPGNVLPKRRIGRQEEIMFIPLLLFFVLSLVSCASAVQAIILFRGRLSLDRHLHRYKL